MSQIYGNLLLEFQEFRQFPGLGTSVHIGPLTQHEQEVLVKVENKSTRLNVETCQLTKLLILNF